MKNTFLKRSALFGFLSLLLASCTDLDEIPRDEFTPSNFFLTEADAEAAVTSAYAGVAADEVWNFGIGWGGTDICFYRWQDPFSSYVGLNADFTITSLIYTDLYSGVGRANTAIIGITGMENIDESLRVQLLAEAKFLRAYFYYNLTNLFGDLPLLTEPVTSFEETEALAVRTPVADIYNELIIPDLQQAVADLPTLERRQGTVTTYAASLLLAKAYMYRGDYQNANTALDGVIGQANLGLAADYFDLFRVGNEFQSVPGLDGGMVREDIFDAQFSQDFNGNAMVHWMGSESFNPLSNGGAGWSNILPTVDYVNMFDQTNDVRFQQIYTDAFGDRDLRDEDLTNEWLYNVRKYMDDSGAAPNNEGGMNIHILRYADALLLKAEAVNELNGPDAAYQYINPVRRRAGISELSGLSKDQLLDSIKVERARELGFEDNRRFDLLRWGDLVTAVRGLSEDRTDGPANIQEHNVLMPIPQSEIDATNGKLGQNPGYAAGGN